MEVPLKVGDRVKHVFRIPEEYGTVVAINTQIVVDWDSGNLSKWYLLDGRINGSQSGPSIKKITPLEELL